MVINNSSFVVAWGTYLTLASTNTVRNHGHIYYVETRNLTTIDASFFYRIDRIKFHP